MNLKLARVWWAVTLRGVAGVIVGIFALSRPGITLVTLVIAFGVYAMCDGVLAIMGAMHASLGAERWVPLMVEGIAGTCVGLATFMWPVITATALLFLIGIWAVVREFIEGVVAIRVRKAILGERVSAIGESVSILFGVIFLIELVIGAIALSLTAAIYALVSGLTSIALGLRLRYLARGPETWGRAALGLH